MMSKKIFMIGFTQFSREPACVDSGIWQHLWTLAGLVEGIEVLQRWGKVAAVGTHRSMRNAISVQTFSYTLEPDSVAVALSMTTLQQTSVNRWYCQQRCWSSWPRVSLKHEVRQGTRLPHKTTHLSTSDKPQCPILCMRQEHVLLLTCPSFRNCTGTGTSLRSSGRKSVRRTCLDSRTRTLASYPTRARTLFASAGLQHENSSVRLTPVPTACLLAIELREAYHIEEPCNESG